MSNASQIVALHNLSNIKDFLSLKRNIASINRSCAIDVTPFNTFVCIVDIFQLWNNLGCYEHTLKTDVHLSNSLIMKVGFIRL